MVEISQRASGQRNVTLNVWGTIRGLDGKEIDVPLPKEGLKLSSLVWLIEEKMGLYLCQTPEEVWIPMESRNSVRFDHSLIVPVAKLYLRAFTNSPFEGDFERSFFLVMDFDQ